MNYTKGERPDFVEFKQLVKPPFSGVLLNYLFVMPRVLANTGNMRGVKYFYQGTAYVSAALKASGRKVFTLSFNDDDDTEGRLAKEIADNKIDVVLIGGTTHLFPFIKLVCDISKRINPDIVTIIGGGAVTSAPIPFMQAVETADYGIVGEGEITVCELAYAIESNCARSALNGVRSIVYKDGKNWVTTVKRDDISDLDIIPWPDYTGFNYEDYLIEFRTNFKNNSIRRYRGGTIVFGRSCPFKCTFCFHPSGTRYRRRGLDSFFAELDYLIANYRLDYLLINDELLFSNTKLVDEFCARIKTYNVLWVCSLRVDIFNLEFANKLVESGCVFFAFGLESANDIVLKSMRKKVTVKQIENALAICHEIGVSGQGNFIFGDLEETYETAMSTINWTDERPWLNNINFAWIITFPGSHLYEVALQRGIIPDPVRFIKEGCPVVNVSKMTGKERQAVEAEMLLRNYQINQHTILSDVELTQGDRGTTHIEGNCPYCGKRSVWNDLDPFRPSEDVKCPHCDAMIVLFASDYVEKEVFENNVAKLPIKNGLALWAIVGGIKQIVEKGFSRVYDKIVFVDKSESKQGMEILGKTIMPPSIIDENRIETVVITITTKKSDEIISEIRSQFPSVKKIVFVGDLIVDCALSER